MEQITTEKRIIDCDPILLKDNPWQTRTHYDETAIAELAESIGRLGLLQPPVGRQVINGEGKYVELAFGHSRARACRQLGRLIPVEIRQISDEDMARIAWAENRDRKDITAIEEARALQAMLEEFSWTQEQLSAEVGLDRSTIANKLRLLELPEVVMEAVEGGQCSERTALALYPIARLTEEEKALHKKEFDWNQQPDDIIRNAVSGDHSSDQIRDSVKWLRDRLKRAKERAKERAATLEKLQNLPEGVIDLSKMDYRDYETCRESVKGCSKHCARRRARWRWRHEQRNQ